MWVECRRRCPRATDHQSGVWRSHSDPARFPAPRSCLCLSPSSVTLRETHICQIWWKQTRLTDKTLEEVQPWQRWSCRCTRCSWGCGWWPLRNARGIAAGLVRYGCRTLLCSTHSGLHSCRQHPPNFQPSWPRIQNVLAHHVDCDVFRFSSMSMEYLPGQSDIHHPCWQNLKWFAPEFILPSLVC